MRLYQQKIAKIMGARLISYDCGHYIHHFKSDEMCKEMIEFVNQEKFEIIESIGGELR